ncbi:MAG TPA: SAM-dependent methyltransferase [Thermomicrobiales bacterium]|nr:SAM-dependent methyltransferase [Thermomicrobiales bacterium]
MSAPKEPQPRAARFEQLYRNDPDPWRYETSHYEREKFTATLAALPRATYSSALEIGCSIGVLTELLARRCERLLAIDAAQTAVRRAAERCRDLPQVRVAGGHVPDEFPDGAFDLIVLSETGYYLSPADLRATAERIVSALTPGGQLLLAHSVELIDDATMPGDEVHAAFITGFSTELRHRFGQRRERYRLDLLERVSG